MTELIKEHIREILPQSEPLLLVDQAKIDQGHYAEGKCYIDPEWDIFRGHFKDHPVLPGIYITESMAQTADLALLTRPGKEGKLPLFMGISQMRFMRPVYPGETLECLATMVYDGGPVEMYEFTVSATSNGKKVASGKITLALRDAE